MMKYIILILTPFIAFSGTRLEGATLTRSTEGFELIAKDGSLRARIFVGANNLLLDFPIQQRGYLFKPDSYVYLNRSEKSYTVHSYGDLLAGLPNKAQSENFDRQQSASTDVRMTGFRETGEIDLIAGFPATKLVGGGREKGDIEIWVSEEITPPALRTVGRKIREMLPTNYWAGEYRLPTVVQTILVYGVPLRIVDHEIEGKDVEAIAMKRADIAHSSFKIPSEYREKVYISQ